MIIIIVDVRCTLLHTYIAYGPKRPITIVCDRKRLYIFVYDTEKYDRNTEPCNTVGYVPFVESLNHYPAVYGFHNRRPG